MGQMINKGNELIRINPKDSNRLEYSTDGGRVWMNRFAGSSLCGSFNDLSDNGKEILGLTSNGLFYSTDGGRVWARRGR